MYDIILPNKTMHLGKRLNQTSIIVQRPGVYYGQCSEICGVYHAFMPIVVEAVTLDKYLMWLDSQV